MRPQPINIDLSLPLDLPANAADPIAVTQAYWEKEIGYTCEAERTLVRQMAAARSRADRCQDADDAHLALADQRARARQLADRRKRVRKLAQSLEKRPAATLKRLEATPEGRDWLTRHWNEIDDRLAQDIPLTDDQRRLALHLSGCHDAQPGPDASPFVRQLHDSLTAAQRTTTPANAAPDSSTPRRWLRALCDQQRTRLEGLTRNDADPDPDPPAETQAEHRARLADARLQATDPEAKARRQIEHQADQSYARNLSLLMRLRNGQQREREWELKEARRRPPRDDHRATPVPAHQASKQARQDTCEESTHGAPQRTTSAPTSQSGATTTALSGQAAPPQYPASSNTQPPAHQPRPDSANANLSNGSVIPTPSAPQRTSGAPHPHKCALPSTNQTKPNPESADPEDTQHPPPGGGDPPLRVGGGAVQSTSIDDRDRPGGTARANGVF